MVNFFFENLLGRDNNDKKEKCLIIIKVISDLSKIKLTTLDQSYQAMKIWGALADKLIHSHGYNFWQLVRKRVYIYMNNEHLN